MEWSFSIASSGSVAMWVVKASALLLFELWHVQRFFLRALVDNQDYLHGLDWWFVGLNPWLL